MHECIFCKIIAGEMPAFFVHEDECAVVFLDVDQGARGHLLIVPREHRALWHEQDAATIGHLGLLAAQWAEPTMAAVGAEGYNLLQNNSAAAGQEVRHVHLHLIPRWQGDGYFRGGSRHRRADAEELRATASLLKAAQQGSA